MSMPKPKEVEEKAFSQETKRHNSTPKQKKGVIGANEGKRSYSLYRPTSSIESGPIALRESSQGWELIWEYDTVLDTFVSNHQPIVAKPASTLDEEQKELSQ